MLGEKAHDLLKDLARTPDNIPPFNDEGFRRVLAEMNSLYFDNQRDLRELEADDTNTQDTIPNIALRHAALERNERCALAYMHNRLQRIRKMRWDLGCLLPPEVKMNLSNGELKWVKTYSKLLASYMTTIGDGIGLNITQDIKPPKSFYIEVKSNENYGRFEMECGSVVMLKKNGVYHLQRSECEVLVRQGILEHIA
ncbi:hypothetical protein RUM43_009689 [Polyplax serrata]|uniref:DNA replication complex GINS protein PSF1 n=1 Tax=Polyplax serrata TaxID=468196 RepID=A0AAN8Q3U9_POLSC